MVFLEEEVGKVTILLCWKGPLKLLQEGAVHLWTFKRPIVLPVAMSVYVPNVDANRSSLDFMLKCAEI